MSVKCLEMFAEKWMCHQSKACYHSFVGWLTIQVRNISHPLYIWILPQIICI